MDSGFRDKKGYVAVMSRSDDVINVAGHRLSTGALEEVSFKNVFFSHGKSDNVINLRRYVANLTSLCNIAFLWLTSGFNVADSRLM